jgi:hypothetical protein
MTAHPLARRDRLVPEILIKEQARPEEHKRCDTDQLFDCVPMHLDLHIQDLISRLSERGVNQGLRKQRGVDCLALTIAGLIDV